MLGIKMFILLKTIDFKSGFLTKEILPFISLFCFGLTLAQLPKTIESINKEFEKVIQTSDSTKPEKAISQLEKIKEEAEAIGYNAGVTRVGYTQAIIYFNSSDYKKVIDLDEEYLKLGYQIKDFENVSHIHRLKGCAYSELGLLSQGSEEYDMALENARKITKGNKRQYALSLIYSNLANHMMKAAAPQDSVLANIRKCIAEAEKIEETDEASILKKYSLIAYSYIIMANEYEKVEKWDLAEKYYLKSLEIHNSKSVPLVERVILLNQLGNFYYNQKDFEKSVRYAEQGLAIEKTASIPQLRRDLFEVLSKSYMELHETDQSKKYLRLFSELNDSLSSVNKQAVDAAVNKTISKQKEEFRMNNSSKQAIIYSLVGIVLAIIGISLFFYYKKQNQIKKIKKVLEQLKTKQENPESNLVKTSKPDKTKEKEEKTPIMPPEAEEKLLEKLQDFENKQLFLERKVSLPYVAAEIETNTKYLSYIIKKHKGKDFNEYINDLRINYIVRKITDDPIYRQYKINTLAEETGFSSHSKFATVFKATIGVSPSEFIRYFQQNEK